MAAEAVPQCPLSRTATADCRGRQERPRDRGNSGTPTGGSDHNTRDTRRTPGSESEGNKERNQPACSNWKAIFSSQSLQNSPIQQIRSHDSHSCFKISPEGFEQWSLQLEAVSHSPPHRPSQTCSLPRSMRFSPRNLSLSHSGQSQTH